MKKTWLLWILSILITLFAAYYQRSTGPTNPKNVQTAVAESTYTLTYPRSLRTVITPEQAQGDWEALLKTTTLRIRVKAKDGVPPFPADIPMHLYYKRARSVGDWEVAEALFKHEGRIEAVLPSQPPAGKLAYYLEIDGVSLFQDSPIIVRFRNNVPAWALIPHILFMYVAMLLSTLCGFLALRNDIRWKKYAKLTVATLLIGGLILGPIIQKFAFGAYWTGWPLGDDLTDTKTLIAAAFWVVALIFSTKKPGRWLAIAAAVALLTIFSIPHSTSGSEFNYETGLVGTEGKN
ncbi:MAG: hypothetical protein FWD56_04585 [Bacteroidales bacterium]|nr:hypothetical protein [Bacteroidales bacterium]